MASKTLNTILSLTDNTSKKLVKVASGFKSLSKEAQKATLSAQKSINKLGPALEKGIDKAIKKVGKIGTAIGGLALGTGLAEGFNLEGYRTQLETATKSTEKAADIMKYSIDLANKTPFEGGEMVEASSKLEAMGISAKDYLSNIVDMAAATNKPLDQATEAFIDAQTGELERLKEFGIKKSDIQQKADEMFAGQETINNKGQIVNQDNFNKALLAIMENRYKGGAEKLANTTKGMLSTVSGVVKSALSKIVGIEEDGTIKSGSLIDKVKEKVKALADKLTQWQSDGTLDNIANKATQVFGVVYNIISGVVNFIIDHKDIIITIGSMAVAFAAVMKIMKGLNLVTNAFKMAWAILNGTLLISPIGWIVIGITAVVGIFTLLWLKCEGFRKIVISIGQTVMTWFQNTILPIIKNIWSSLQQFWNTVVVPFANWIMAVLQPIFQTVFPIIKKYVSDCFSGIGLVIKGALECFNGIIDFVTGVFSGDWSKAWDGIKEIFGGIWDSLEGCAKAPLNAVISLVNKAIDGINSFSFTAPDWVPEIGGQTISPNIPNIPQLAIGSNYTKEGLTLVGENGPELVQMPEGAKVNTNSQTKKLLGNKDVNINVKIDTFVGEESFADRCGEIIVGKVKLALANM
ncbi:hypothetical protein [Clostridium sp. BJN0001]|uniref:hypothetical protein n=1 Tax=Clostridium sp. BJN0001 TaxID=2930219 RepID=UPI001FD097F3|nr:hypothetical protein [Clostridium sp. BJN0001]